MTSKKNLIITSIVFILLFAVSIVSATIDVTTYTPSKDFSLTSQYDKVDVCACQTKYDTITVANPGTWPAIFTISTNVVKSKITFSESSFELNPGQSKDVFMYINADCSKGTDDLQITVSSNLGGQKTILKTITRNRCQNIEFWVSNYTKDINPCQQNTFALNIHNTGSFTETYVIGSNFDDYIKYNAKSVTLEPNQYSEVSATTNFDCSIYGRKDIIFSVDSVKNKLTASLDAALNILKNYDYSVKINNGANNTVGLAVCNRVLSTKIPVTVTNNGTVANKYTVKIDDLPKSAKITGIVDNTFSLNPKESKTFMIDIDSTVYRYEHKDKTVTIKIDSELGDIEKVSKLSLNFQPCYEHQVVIYDGQKTNKNPLETCSKYDYSYDVEVINNGAFKETYKLSLEGAPSSVKLSKNTLTIAPGNRDTVNLLITGPEYNTYYDVKVDATIQNGITESDDTWIKSYDTQNCHMTTLGRDRFNINYQTDTINIPIKNIGLEDNNYIVSWDGSGIVNGDDQLLSLNKSHSAKISLKLQSTGLNESVYTGTVTLRDASGAIYGKDISINLKDKTLFRKAFEYLAFGSICRQASLAELIVILLIIAIIIAFLIIGPHYPYKFSNRFKSKTSVLIFLIVLFLIGFVLVITFAGLPKTESQVYNLRTNSSQLTYEWLQDGKYTLDVSGLFYDPENTTLNYNVSGLKHIKPVINGNIITFYSDLGWSGVEYATITAYDRMGGSVESPEFTLIVLDVPRKPAIELYNVYCWYVNLAIYAVILVLIFTAVFVKQKKRGRK